MSMRVYFRKHMLGKIKGESKRKVGKRYVNLNKIVN